MLKKLDVADEDDEVRNANSHGSVWLQVRAEEPSV
jgi:hypothetical protein